MQRTPFVHVGFVFARPAECFSFCDLEPSEIDLPFTKKVEVMLGKIRSNDSDEIDWLKKAGAYCGIRRGAAQQVGMFFGLCFDAIQRNGTHNQYGHGGTQLSKPGASASLFLGGSDTAPLVRLGRRSKGPNVGGRSLPTTHKASSRLQVGYGLLKARGAVVPSGQDGAGRRPPRAPCQL